MRYPRSLPDSPRRKTAQTLSLFPMQKICILIKPDALDKKVAGKVMDRLERENFHLIAIKMVRPERSVLEKFYSDHAGKPFFEGLVEFMCSAPFIAMVWEGEEIIARVRKLIGATNSCEAEAGTLRRLYGTDNRKNLVHASDSAQSAEREIQVLFDESEILSPSPQSSLSEPARSPSRGRSWLVPTSSSGHSPLKGEDNLSIPSPLGGEGGGEG